MSRRGYEFDRRTKDQAINKYLRENPDADPNDLEVHHKVPIHYMKENGIPPAVGASAQNAEALPREQHRELHRNSSEEEYKTIAQGLIGFVRRLVG